MVEPVPYVFDRLQKQLRGHGPGHAGQRGDRRPGRGGCPSTTCARPSDADRDGLPEWYDGLGSFSREAVLGHGRRIPDIERLLVTTEVPCLTFASLCETHGVDKVDLLLIDTEGYGSTGSCCRRSISRRCGRGW